MPNLSGAVVARSSNAAIPYPGRLIKRGEKDKVIVTAVQHRLNESGCGPIDEDGDFGKNTESAVKLFQARFGDDEGQPLRVDGMVGSLTWAQLFGERAILPPVKPPTVPPLLGKVLEFAATQVGVLEKPLGSNRGPQVDLYLRSVGLDPKSGSYAWCVAFVYYCFQQASAQLGLPNPMARTAGVLDLWARAGRAKTHRITGAQALDDPSLVRPGHIFVIDTGGGNGHAGLVESASGGKLVTIEGNTNDGGSREGIGVFRRTQRRVAQINKGFVDYGG
jgi:hypothetical protein